MGIFSGIVNYQNFEVESGITSNFFISPTISANTISGGALSALYVASGKVTNQEFKYLSGTTSNIQIQINSLANKNEAFLTLTNSTELDVEKSVIAGDMITINQSSSEFELNTRLTSTEVQSHVVTNTFSAITNWNPSGSNSWQENENRRSTHIILNSSSISSVISGLSGGSNGRIVIITSLSDNIFCFENNSTKCDPSCRFEFSMGSAYFLTRNKTISLIYDSIKQKWIELFSINYKTMFDYFNDFNYRTLSSVGTGGALFNGGEYINFRDSSFGRIGYTGFNSNNSVVFISGSSTNTISNTSSSSSLCAGRSINTNTPTKSAFALFNVMLNSDFGNIFSSSTINSNVNQLTIRLTIAGEPRNYFQVCNTSLVNNAYWTVSGDSWFAKTIKSDINLTQNINKFIYLGIHITSSAQLYFYSYDNNEYGTYLISATTVLGYPIIATFAQTTIPTKPIIFCDWYGFKVD